MRTDNHRFQKDRERLMSSPAATPRSAFSPCHPYDRNNHQDDHRKENYPAEEIPKLKSAHFILPIIGKSLDWNTVGRDRGSFGGQCRAMRDSDTVRLMIGLDLDPARHPLSVSSHVTADSVIPGPMFTSFGVSRYPVSLARRYCILSAQTHRRCTRFRSAHRLGQVWTYSHHDSSSWMRRHLQYRTYTDGTGVYVYARDPPGPFPV
jgi:hypothetical protein